LSDTEGPGWRRPAGELAPLLIGVIVAVVFNVYFHGGLVGELDTRLITGAFHHGHVWCFDHVWRALSGQDAWGVATDRLGFPSSAAARCLAVVPALVVAPTRLWLSPLGAYNLAILLTPAPAVACTWLLARRVAGVSSGAAAAAGVLFAVSPYVLGCFAGGQTCKAQVWGLPLALWALSGAVGGPRRAAFLVAVPISTLLLAFSEPTYAAILPLAAVPWAVLSLRRPVLPHVGGALVALAAMAGALLLVRGYYTMGDDRLLVEAFDPASRLKSAGIPIPTPMAQPGPTLLGPPDLQTQPGVANHITYLGVPLLALTLLSLALARRGRLFLLAAFAVGFTISLGEFLVVDNAWVTNGGQKYGLPALLLARYGYPLSQSVMYYRAIVVAALAVAIGSVAWTARWRYGAWAAAVVAAVGLWDTHRATAPLWTLRSAVPSHALHDRIAADAVPGAVVALPLRASAPTGAQAMFDAALHGRATNGLARFTAAGFPPVDTIEAWFAEAEALGPGAGDDALFGHGIRYIVTMPQVEVPERAALSRVLGPPRRAGDRLYWRVGPDALD
jgi:hypothetical protein